MSAPSLGSFSTPPSVLRQRWFLVGLCVFFLAVTVNYLLKIHNSDRATRTAFLRWAGQLEQLENGTNIWQEHIYPNPPIMALILKPLTEVDPFWGSMIWFFLKAVMAVLAIHWLFSMLETSGRPFPLWGKVLALVLVIRPVQGDLMHGNVNLFILFLVVGALYAYCRGWDVVAGLTLGLSIACKVTPALFVPYFVWKKGWRVLAGCAAGLLLWLLLVPGVFLGFDKNHEALTSWFENMIVPFVVKGEVTPEHNNQSLPGLAMRMLAEYPSFSTYVDNIHYTPVEFHNIASLNPEAIRWGIKVCLGLFALLVVWSCRTPVAARDVPSGMAGRTNWLLWAEFSFVALGMLLFSERTWKHHCVMLLLPFGVIGYALSSRWEDKRLRTYLLTTVVLVFLLMASTSTGLFDKHDRFGKLAQVYGAYVWAYLLLMAAMVVILRRCRSAEGAAPRGSKNHPAACESTSLARI